MKLFHSSALPMAAVLVFASTSQAQVATPPSASPAVSGTDNGPLDPLASTPEDNKKYGSLYLRCDGQPNNITGMENFARLLGAVTLLSIFAPNPEMADPSKRLFGSKGVAACSKLLDDPTEETNGLRRLPLILARAAHRIEAKEYDGALADVVKARGEAKTLGLAGNPYFERSMGLSFNLLESQILLRMGKPDEARRVGVRNVIAMPYSLYAAIMSRPYAFLLHDISSEEEQQQRNMARLSGLFGSGYADRLEEVGRFADAARIRDDMVEFLSGIDSEEPRSWPLATAAISHALAGQWDVAADNARRAREVMATRVAVGKPEDDQSAVVERLDLYAVLLLAHEGRMDDARRNFAARSQWMAPSFGAILAANALLRKDARPDQLIGSLGDGPDALWSAREKSETAKMLKADSGNRMLFSFILPYAQIRDYEQLSKDVWNTQKSKLLAKEPMKNSKFYAILLINGGALTQPEALLLHAALQAKARGVKGFTFMALPRQPQAGFVRFGNPGEPGMTDNAYIDADAVIADLRKVIPSPDELAARRRASA